MGNGVVVLAVAWEALRFEVVVVIWSSSEEERSEEAPSSMKGSKSLMVSIDRPRGGRF